MLVVRIRGIIEALVVCVGSKGIRYYQITAIDEYSRKRVLKVVKGKSTYDRNEKFIMPINIYIKCLIN
ncbi:hypothetical protein [Streptobacillus moniliformis]|uniref:hypothetical protein n=1 Tax=Streptobacillus moniliformis TaxID=34105 RepID=UPI0007E2F485|nr:hypothetical protein [Streptobacillus moniliformis]